MATTDQLQFFAGAKTQEISSVNFFQILTSHSLQHEDVQVFFKDATKIQIGCQRSTPNFFMGAKTLKL